MGTFTHTHSFPFALHVKGSVHFVRLHIKGSVRRLFVGCGLYVHERDGTVIRSHLEGSRTPFVQGAAKRNAAIGHRCVAKLPVAHIIQYVYLVYSEYQLYLLYLFYAYYNFEVRLRKGFDQGRT